MYLYFLGYYYLVHLLHTVAEEWFGFEQGPMLQAVVSEAIAFTEVCVRVLSHRQVGSLFLWVFQLQAIRMVVV